MDMDSLIMNICCSCTTRKAEFVCCCNWPLNQLLCPDDLTKHQACPSSALPHHVLPISFLDKLTTKEQFDRFRQSLAIIKQAKTQLNQKISKFDALSDKFGEACDEVILKFQELRGSYRAKIEAKSRLLKESVQAFINEEERRIAEPEYLIRDSLSNDIDQRMSDIKGVLSTMKKKEKKFVMSSLKSWKAHITHCQDGKTVDFGKMLKRDWKDEIFNLEAQITAVALCCCLPLSLCWPLVGLWQAVNNDRSTCFCDICEGTFVCLLPTLLCCLGAAINRSRYMRGLGVKTSFLLDLSLFSMHIWNACLICQERSLGEAYWRRNNRKNFFR